MKSSVGMDYTLYESDGIGFDYEAMMAGIGYSLDDIAAIQAAGGVGNTPLIELKNITELARRSAARGRGARIFIKDEAANPSGSFKARRAAVSVYQAKKLGFKGVMAATSGNYGAAVASQAAMAGLKCIIVQECYDSEGRGQPEILEKARKCEAYGAEVLQLSVGPELFYVYLLLLEETGYFNASLYTAFGIAGVETLGMELILQCRKMVGKDPDTVVVTNAGGGNLTGTARGILKAGGQGVEIIGASVDLAGLHMASDRDFNKKSFTTGHTGFGVPFCTNPDRSDVPRSAARPLRYMDRYVTVKQGEVFYTTEALARLEGLERGPAGNTSLAAALALAREMKQDEILVVQETEYTGAGKHILPQLSFARANGIKIEIGDPGHEVPGMNIVLPSDPGKMGVRELDLMKIKTSYLRRFIKEGNRAPLTEADMDYLSAELRLSRERVGEILEKLGETEK
ncbi:MAG: PLP-dependent lyase/thiolase [Spirochaetales bacterium]|nr:PLP-dependent lyase/thiolase [Spirochaetales bacterium]